MSARILLQVSVEGLAEGLLNAEKEAQRELLSAFAISDNSKLRELPETLKTLWVTLEPDDEEEVLAGQFAVAELPGSYETSHKSGSAATVSVTTDEFVDAISDLPADSLDMLIRRMIEITDDVVMDFVNREIHSMRAEQSAASRG